ncbi:MAG: glycosyltransferase, partial [Myxococcota bacterium]
AAAAAALNQIDTARALLNRADAAPTDPRRVAMRDNVRAVLYGETLLKELTGGQMNVGAVQAPEMIADGEDRFARGDLDGAVDRFVRALTAAPGSATAWINLGVSLHAAGLIDGSRRALQQAVRLDPTAREGWMSLGHLSAESGRIDQAAEAFRRVLDLNPGDEEAYAALVILGLEGDAEQDTAPLLSVVFIDTASKATITGALDHLALQDLHPSLFEVVLNTQETSHKRAFTVRHSDQPVEDARGRWLVVFQSTDRPQRDVLRKHLAAQVTEDGPVAVQGARIFDAERIASEPMVAAINTLPQTGAPLSNLSIPRTHIDILPRLRWKPTGAGVKIVRDSAITCLRGEPVTVEGFLAAQRSGGEANRRAWQRDPSIPVHNLPGNPGTEEGWLAARIQFERFQPQVDAARSRIDAARSVGGSIPADALVIVARQAWRAGLLSDVLPSRGQRALSSALTSIIIPNLNGMPHLIGCVDSIRRHTRGPVELIVVDNGSNDGSLEWLQEQSDIVLIEMGENVGAPAARNRGLAVARGETILFCDNDVIFTPRWRPLLLRHLETYDDVGMVGPMSDYVIGPQKVDPMPPAQVALDDYATAFTRQRTGQHIYTRRLILFFIMARREVFDQIGGIDEGYGRWGFEDDDLCVRVNLAGYRMRVAGDCFIRHLGSQTARTARINYDELLQKNWQVFKNKWGLDPALPYGPYDHEVIAAQTFSAEALFVPYKNGVRSPKTPIKLVSMR